MIAVIEGGSGRPFGSPPHGVADRGYVIEEFLLEGTAHSYSPLADPGLDGHWRVDPGEEAGYRTRMYVVRPADRERFNGVVLVNWQNVTAGVDLGVPPREAYEGYAWVGVTTQRVAIEGQPALNGGLPATRGLPETDPARYGTLHHPGDAYSYDILTDAARTVAPGRAAGTVDPLGGFEPHTILATGGSQSAMRLGSYLNLVHQRERVFDGFLLTVHWGKCPRPPDQRLWDSFALGPDGLAASTGRIRDDGGVPVLVLSTESETMHNFPVRQPDTDTFRFWEMAGTAHAAGGGFEMLAEGVPGVDLLGALGDTMQINTVKWEYVGDAALRHLVAWVRRGEAPPRFPPIDVDAGPPASIHRDEFGNATGGIRLPELVAPTAHHRGDNDDNPFLALFGQSVPFTAEEIRARYPDREVYLATWDAAIDDLVASGLDIGPEVDAVRARGHQLADDCFT